MLSPDGADPVWLQGLESVYWNISGASPVLLQVLKDMLGPYGVSSVAQDSRMRTWRLQAKGPNLVATVMLDL